MNELHNDDRLLRGLEIIELGEGLTSSLCGRMLADLGATVVKIEPPTGDWLREFEPQRAGVSLAYRQCSLGKTVLRPPSMEAYQRAVQKAVSTADAVFDHPSSHADKSALTWLRTTASIVMCTIYDGGFGESTLLGENGVQATTGLCGYLGSVLEQPRSVRADVAGIAAATFAAQGILAALLARGRSGVSCNVEVSTTRAIAAIKSLTWAAQHSPDTWTGFHCNAETGPVQGPYTASDRPISFDLGGVDMPDYRRLADELGLDIDMTGLSPSDIAGFGDDAVRYKAAINGAIAKTSAHDVGLAVQRARGISVPYTSLADVTGTEQIRSLDAFYEMSGPDDVAVKTPIRSVSAPAIEKSALRSGTTEKELSATDGPLAGVTVIDLGIAGVGPWGVALLAYLGAEVVKVESPAGDMIQQVEPDQNGHRTTYAALNLGKQIRVLDLKTTEGLDALKRAIVTSDVIAENFRPGVMARLGLDAKEISTLNPRIVSFSATGYGVEGPLAARRATDGHIQALSGFAAANGRTGTPEVLRYNGFLDLLTSTMNSLGIVAGLLHTQRTGRGARVTNTMLGTALFAEQVALASAVAGIEEPTNLSERAEYAPAGAFPTKDGWIAVDVRNDREWKALQSVLIPRAGDSATENFETNSARCKNREALRRWIESRTRQLPTRAWVLLFDRVGVPGAAYTRDAENLGRAEAGDDSLIASTSDELYGPLFVGSPPWVFSDLACSVPPPPRPFEDTSNGTNRVGAAQ
jgi:crotonobetainyl-CoA:carnitine CoA-transferase CaiB-like acyl-CoA transferase